jgi:elongation factor Ts
MSTMAISAKDVAQLRARTGAGMMDCKKALEEAQGDMDKAAEILRKKGIAKAETRTERTASQGLVVIDPAPDGKSAAMIELDCETDFVARTSDFIGLAKELGKHAAAHAPFGVNPGSAIDAQPFQGKTVAEVVKAMSGKTGEAMSLKRVARLEAKDGVVGAYLHHNGQSGALVAVDGPHNDAVSELARELALHVAFADPAGISDADVPTELVERERRIAEEQVAAEGKPENIRGKIVEGKVRKFLAERTLMGQPFVRDDKKPVAELVKETAAKTGAPVTVRAIARFRVGEG